MISPFACLPSLILCGFIVALRTPPPTDAAPSVNAPGMRELQRNVRTASQRLHTFEAQQHHVVPRGGLTLFAAPPLTSAARVA